MIDISKFTYDQLKQTVEWLDDERGHQFLNGLNEGYNREVNKLIAGFKSEDRRAEDELRGSIKLIGFIFSMRDKCVKQLREIELHEDDTHPLDTKRKT